jgi:hypothetical protein
MTKKFSLEAIEQAFREIEDQEMTQEFIGILTTKQDELDKAETRRKAEEAKFKKIEIYEHNIHPETTEDVTNFLTERVKNGDYYDLFADDDLPDEGSDDVEYHKIGDRIYELSLHCEAEWIGDWSVRANVPGEITITSLREITDFEVIEARDSYITLRIRK